MKQLRTIFSRILIGVVLSLFLVNGTLAGTISNTDRSAIDIDNLYYLSEYQNNDCSSVGAAPNLPVGPVWILGDSIVDGARGDITSYLAAGAYTLADINTDLGRAISSDTEPPGSSGLEAVAANSTAIATVGTVVVALGTYSGTESLNEQIPRLVAAIRGANINVKIMWVNLFYNPANSRDARNRTIASQAGPNNYTVIDANAANIELGPDGILPTAVGNQALGNAIVNALGGSTSQVPTPVPGGGGGGAYDPLALSFPNFPDEAAIGTNMTNYIRDGWPDSPFLTIPGIGDGIGAWIVAESRSRNINPLFIAAAGKMENGYGTVGSAPRQNNYFGMTNGRGGYLTFPSPQAGITAFMDAIRNNIYGNGAGGRYRSAQNIYEYFSIHQSGVIAYPGDNLDPQDVSGPGGRPDGNRLDGFDPIMDVYVSWTRNDHPNNRYDGQLFNPLIYHRSNIATINAITGLSLSPDNPRSAQSAPPAGCAETPGGGGGPGGAGTEGGGCGNLTTNRYSFPLEPGTRAVGGIVVGQTRTRHWDGTDAFDLFSFPGADVCAIYSGVAVTVNRNFNQVAGCSSIQLRADDGFYYWMGHLSNVAINQGDRVNAGQRISEFANESFGTRCTGGGGPHLHIDRGCTINGVPQRGGRDECRDPAFIPFLAEIYAGLPPG